MKKFLSTILVSTMAISMCSAVLADNEPTISVDGRNIIFFEEQAPVIQNDRLYVPLRRVLETMGESVEWNDATKTVTVNSKDNITRLLLTIDNKEITAYTFTSVLNANKTTVTSDVAPIIMNDRTMLPIRVIAENLGATVKWDENTNATTITTKQAKVFAEQNKVDTSAEDFSIPNAFKESVPNLYIESDAKDVNKGDNVTIKVKLKDLAKYNENAKLCSASIGLAYDTENFMFSGYKCIVDGKEVEPSMTAHNDDFYNHCAKMIFLNSEDKALVPGKDDGFMEVEFTALTDNGGEFKLSNGITSIGNDTELVISDSNSQLKTISTYNQLFIDQTPVIIK